MIIPLTLLKFIFSFFAGYGFSAFLKDIKN